MPPNCRIRKWDQKNTRENIAAENTSSEFKINLCSFRLNRLRLDKILSCPICYMLYNMFDAKEEFRIW